MENPFLFVSFEEASELFGLGRGVMTRFAAMGAPVVAKKVNPKLLFEWLRENWREVGKIRAANGDNV